MRFKLHVCFWFLHLGSYVAFSVSHVMLSLYPNPMWFRTRCRNIQFAFGFESCTTFIALPPTSECLFQVRKTWAFDTRVLELKWVGARQTSPRPLRVRGDHVRGQSWTEASERMYTVRMHRPFLATWNMSKRGGPHINHGSSGDFSCIINRHSTEYLEHELPTVI